jgi:mono/diheme cytochrome c family protein
MPHWGIQGLKPRDIDAVAAYILKNLVSPADSAAQTPSE